ncbi:hypothetical protein [Bacillus altitudinis]|uniref:hypothetical protein n=1 Tax=Bacillus altitudinis TaxID=293387 RepID=UPI0021019762|nr:hypothetical protein [Bacillus altitudinis]UTV34833.1 hypothetical protein NM966_19765 [Bacillus altitudinis]
MNYRKNVITLQTSIDHEITNSLPNLAEFMYFQEKRIVHELEKYVDEKVKFTRSTDPYALKEVVRGEVAILHVDEYAKLVTDFERLKKEHTELQKIVYQSRRK